jgi:hypothetical protein
MMPAQPKVPKAHIGGGWCRAGLVCLVDEHAAACSHPQTAKTTQTSRRKDPDERAVCDRNGRAAVALLRCWAVMASVWTWTASWFWGLLLVLVTLGMHSFAVVLMARMMQRAGRRGFYGMAFRRSVSLSTMLLGGAGLFLAVLHGIEAAVWALAYLLLGVVGTLDNAMFYSINLMSSRMTPALMLDERWRILGALEGLNGILLFGISTAFAFAVIQEVMAPRPPWETRVGP